MKCQNCGSTDIVSIQGENYCINCGQKVNAPVAKVPSDQPGTKTIAAVAPKKDKPKHAKHGGRTLNLRPMPEDTDELEKIKAHPWRFTVGLSAMIGAVAGLAVGASLGLQLDRDISLYLLTSTLVLTSVTLVLTQSALMYGLSKNQDGRNSHRTQWWAAARSGFMDLLNLDLMSIIGALLLIAAGFGAYQGLSAYLQPGWGLILALSAINAVLAWGMVGIFISRRMAIPAVVVGGMTAWAGYKIGWNAYLKFGGKLAVASVETLLIRISVSVLLAALVLALFKYGVGWGSSEIALAAGAATAVGLFALFMVTLQLELRLWLAQYRFWMPATHPQGRAQLLGGRRGHRT